MRQNKQARLLTMDELQNRPCEVDGRPALFHRWVEEDRVVLHVNRFVCEDEREYLLHRFRRDSFVMPGCSTDVIRNTLALVEYEGGTVAKVDPELIRFIGEGATQ
jgi:RecA-family ATPase